MERSHTVKDTCLLSVGNRSSAASCHVAVEGHLESVAVGRVVEKTAKETPTGTGLHHVTVKGSVGLEKQMEKKLRYIKGLDSSLYVGRDAGVWRML